MVFENFFFELTAIPIVKGKKPLKLGMAVLNIAYRHDEKWAGAPMRAAFGRLIVTV